MIEYQEIRSNPCEICISLDKSKYINYISQASKDLLGYNPKDFKGKSIYDFLHKDDFHYFKKIKSPALLFCRFKKSDGTYILLKANVEINSNEKSVHHGSIYESALKSMQEGVIIIGLDRKISFINDAALELTDIPYEQAIGKPLPEILKLKDFNVNRVINELMDNSLEKSSFDDLEIKSKDGRMTALTLSINAIKDLNNIICGGAIILKNASDKSSNFYDSLTGLYNRSFFETEVKRLDTVRQLPISVIIGDLNGLKTINEILGKYEGDKFLLSASGIFKKSCRHEDIIARTGGDEFSILLPRTKSKDAMEICKRIYTASDMNTISISLGYATKEFPNEDIQNVIKSAEDMMLRHKLLDSKSQMSSIILSLRTALFEKSLETEQHAFRLIKLTKKIGLYLSMDDNQLKDMELFSLLHDIGKILIDNNILGKPGKLTKDEWAEIKKHPETGYRIVKASPELTPIAEYILFHHEHWNGKGYPYGISGEKIPVFSRILSIADAYDAMTTDRPYRKAMSKNEACREIRKNMGTQFDPHISKIFLDVITKEDNDYEKNVSDR